MGCLSVRAVGWEGRLTEVLREASRRAYDPARWNCARFTQACVEALVGGPVPAQWRGSLEATVDAIFSRIDSTVAGTGDVVLGEVPDATLGVCLGRLVVFVSPAGLIAHPRSVISVAWRV